MVPFGAYFLIYWAEETSVMYKALKPWLDYEALIDLLQSRGMIIEDKPQAIAFLKKVGYYRLSGYFHVFKLHHNLVRQQVIEIGQNSKFYTGTTFEKVKELYLFDQQLQLLVLECLREIELFLREVANHYLGKQDSLSYMNHCLFTDKESGQKWLECHHRDVRRAKSNPAILHYDRNYGSYPIWVASTTWSFGTLVRLYSVLSRGHQERMIKRFNLGVMSVPHVISHLRSFVFVRNTAAHHARLWNVSVINRPSLKGFFSASWKILDVNKPFAVLCLINQYAQSICPEIRFGERLRGLLDDFPQTGVPLVSLEKGMGVDNRCFDLLV